MKDGGAHADACGEPGDGDRSGRVVVQDAYGSGDLREVTVEAKTGADAGTAGSAECAVEQLAHDRRTKDPGVLRLCSCLKQAQERVPDRSGELLRLKDGESFGAALAEVEVHGAEQFHYDLGAELNEDG